MLRKDVGGGEYASARGVCEATRGHELGGKKRGDQKTFRKNWGVRRQETGSGREGKCWVL